MIEVRGNIWDYPSNVICITTNGITRKDGAAVMGRGVAHQAKTRYPGIEYQLGRLLNEEGNHVWFIFKGKLFLTFPVKHHWKEKADLKLIARSVLEFNEAIRGLDDLIFVLPRPGCGNGQLSWHDVKPLLSSLPDNVHVITNG